MDKSRVDQLEAEVRSAIERARGEGLAEPFLELILAVKTGEVPSKSEWQEERDEAAKEQERVDRKLAQAAKADEEREAEEKRQRERDAAVAAKQAPSKGKPDVDVSGDGSNHPGRSGGTVGKSAER